jgi:hypothetical protein
MFQSFMFGEYGAYNYRDGKYIWGYKLTDSEFGIVSGKITFGNGNRLAIVAALAIIQEYGKRNLNVAANLATAFVWMDKQFPHYSVQDVINVNKKYNPLFKQYEEDLQKYLVLL